MATIGIQTSVGSIGPSGTPDLSVGNFYVAGETPWGIDSAYQVCTSFPMFLRLYGGLNNLISVGSPDIWSYTTNAGVVQCCYNVKTYFAEKQPGSPGVLYFSRVCKSSSGPAAATGTFNDVTAANPTTITSKWKGAAGNTVQITIANPSPRATFTAGPGTITVTQNSGAVTGAGTSFTAASVGQGIQILGVNYVISAFTNATSISISPNYAATSGGSIAYSTAPASCQITAKFPQANITEVWPITAASDATNANQKSELITITLPGNGNLPGPVVNATKLTGGTDVYGASDADLVGTTTAANVKTGLQVFNDQRLGLGYYAIPGHYSSTIRTGIATVASSYYRLGLLSSPSGLNLNTVVSDLAGQASNLCAYYTPQIVVADDNSDIGGGQVISNEGAVAGLAARMIRDYNFGPHKSPAGKTHPFVSVRDIERQSSGQELYDDAASNTLADSGVNTIRSKKGFVVWGLRTLATDRRWLQFNAAQTISQVIVTGQLILENYVMEPIDEKLFARVRADFKVFMLDLYRKGAFYGTEPGQISLASDAYSVVCDRSNNPDQVIVNNQFKVDVAFVPKPNAESIIFSVSPAAPGFAGRSAT